MIIAGASSGIGEAAAYKLAEQGTKLVLAVRREAQLKTIAYKIKANGGEAVYRVTDMVKPEDNAALVELAKTTFSKVTSASSPSARLPSRDRPWQSIPDSWNRFCPCYNRRPA